MKITAIPRSIVWGNNAAWICTKCGELLGGRTADNECEVVPCVVCDMQYEIQRENDSLSRATGVRRIDKKP